MTVGWFDDDENPDTPPIQVVTGWWIEGGFSVSPDAATALAEGLEPVVTVRTNHIFPDPAEAFADGLDPIVNYTASQSISPDPADAIAEGLEPIVIGRQNAIVALDDSAEATAVGLDPIIDHSSSQSISPDTANATADGLAPVVNLGRNALISPLPAEATAEGLEPQVNSTQNAILVPTEANATAEGLTPVIFNESNQSIEIGDVATASADGLIPLLHAEQNAIIIPTLADAQALGLAPVINHTQNQAISPTPATATAEGLIPGLEVINPPPEVLFDATGAGSIVVMPTGSTTFQVTEAHICTDTDTNGVLMVAFSGAAGLVPNPTISCTYNGIPMTLMNSDVAQHKYNSSQMFNCVFYLYNPPEGNHNVVATFVPNGNRLAACTVMLASSSFKNVGSIASSFYYNSGPSGATGNTVGSIPSAVDDMVFFAFSKGQNQTFTFNQTIRKQAGLAATVGMSGMIGDAPGASTVTGTAATATSAPWHGVGVNLQKVA